VFYLVCFDIVEDRARRRTAKVLEGYGVRVQKSVFECAGMTEEQFLKLKERIEECIDATWDSVRYYALCRGCFKRVEYSGIGNPPGEDNQWIV
jgi:CRISPR-associated protein Cas2